MFNFEDALSKTPDQIERPADPPIGNYEFVITKVPQMLRDRGGYDVVEFQCQAVAAQEDVQEQFAEELAAYGPLKKFITRKSFLFARDDETAARRAEADLKDFIIKHLGIDWTPDKNLKMILNETPNRHFIGTVSYQADKTDPERQFVRLGRTAPIV